MPRLYLTVQSSYFQLDHTPKFELLRLTITRTGSKHTALCRDLFVWQRVTDNARTCREFKSLYVLCIRDAVVSNLHQPTHPTINLSTLPA
eukprot:scaffold118308_cov20-Prasinocladus_malaysianus.AAC.1